MYIRVQRHIMPSPISTCSHFDFLPGSDLFRSQSHSAEVSIVGLLKVTEEVVVGAGGKQVGNTNRDTARW